MSNIRCELATFTLLLGCQFCGAAVAEEPSAPVLRKGDRVVFIGDTFADQLRLHGYLETQLATRRPELGLTVRILGWSGDTVTRQPRPLNFGSLDEHLQRLGADVVVACFGMSASLDDPQGAADFGRDLAGLVEHLRGRKYNAARPPRVVLVSPIAREAINSRYGDPAAHNRALAEFAAATQQVAGEQKAAVVDLFAATSALLLDGEKQPLTQDGIHLSEYGYWAASGALADVLVGKAAPWRLEIDAAGPRVEAPREGGPAAAGLKQVEGGIEFTLRGGPLPPAPPVDGEIHAALARQLPKLTVRNLPPGNYALQIDGKTVLKADGRGFAAGATLTSLPGHRAAEELRAEINRKNRWFFYRWRPSNAEYVFGRRTKPFGSVSFPPEMEKFDELIDEQDALIHRLSRAERQETWRVVRVAKP